MSSKQALAIDCVHSSFHIYLVLYSTIHYTRCSIPLKSGYNHSSLSLLSL